MTVFHLHRQRPAGTPAPADPQTRTGEDSYASAPSTSSPVRPPVRITPVDCQQALARDHGGDLTHGATMLELQVAGARAVRAGDEVRAKAYQRAITRRLAEAHRFDPDDEPTAA